MYTQLKQNYQDNIFQKYLLSDRLRRHKVNWLPTLISRILSTIYGCSSNFDGRVSSSGVGWGWLGSVWACLQRVCFECIVAALLLPGAGAWMLLQVYSQVLEWCGRMKVRVTGSKTESGIRTTPSPAMFKITMEDYI
jgi:hypothetical protein